MTLKRPKESLEEDAPIKLFFDWRVLCIALGQVWIWFVLTGVVVFCALFALFYVSSKESMERWVATAKLFHQSRSDKIPSFYKQLDTKVIAELIASSDLMSSVAARLQLLPEQAASLGSLVEIVVENNNPNILNIKCNYNRAKFAAEIANAVAEEGVAMYISRQNQTITDLIKERLSRRVKLNDELTKYEQELLSYAADESLLPPDQEMVRLRAGIAALIAEIDSKDAEIIQHDTEVTELEKALSGIEPRIPYMSKIYNDQGGKLDKLKTDMSLLLQRFEQDHPRVRGLADEIREKERLEASKIELEPSDPNEVVYSVNQVYLSLDETLLRTRILRKSMITRVEQLKKTLESQQALLKKQLTSAAAYENLKRKIEVTKASLTQLDASIGDMTLLLNSGVPDLSILERSAEPRVPRTGLNKVIMMAFVGSLFALFPVVFGWVVFQIFWGRCRSLRELQLVGHLAELGALPADKVSESQMNAALQRCFIGMSEKFGEGKSLFLTTLSDPTSVDLLFRNWSEGFGVNGKSVFKLRFCLYSKRQEADENKSIRRQPIDDALICVQKSGNYGTFYLSNEHVLSPPELELLQVDLMQLKEAYGVVIFVLDEPTQSPDLLFEQLCRLADYTVLTVTFGKDYTLPLRDFARCWAAQQERIGGILTGVSNRFWRLHEHE